MGSIRRGGNQNKDIGFYENVKYVTGSGMGHNTILGSDILKDYTEEERLQLIPKQRESYNAGEITSFEQAKQAADETYMQYWYDTLNEIASEWTDQDYALLENPIYKRDSHRGRTVGRERIEPSRFEEYQEALERIEQGPLDFSSEETHRELIKDNKVQGRYPKRQYWIDEDEPLRQAVEAQADVMKDFLDDAGVPIVQKYEDLEGFKRPDSFRGEGIYLNTGTAAHIDWDSGLKRMQRYQSSPDAELGTYSQVFVRPDPEGLAKPLGVLGALTGNPWIGGAASLAAGGDIEDVLKGAAKSYAIGQITTPILENTVANLGVDADLFGMEPEKFSESMMDVQTTVLKGGDIETALVKELGVPAVKKVAGAFGDVLPDVDFETPQIFKDLEDVVKLGVDPLVDVAQKGIDFVQTATQPFSDITSDIEDVAKKAGREFDEEVLQPVKEGVQAVTEPVVDVVDDIIDAIDSPLGDVLQAGGNLIQGMLGGVVGGQQPQTVSRTPVENIFDKELFKFDTEIKSTQEMLSPMMNLRRYG